MSFKGYVKNCYIVPRYIENPVMFRGIDGKAIAALDGYAVIPLEEYERLSGKDMSELLERVEVLDEPDETGLCVDYFGSDTLDITVAG